MMMIYILNIDGMEVADISSDTPAVTDTAAFEALVKMVKENSSATRMALNREAVSIALLDSGSGFSADVLEALAGKDMHVAVYGDFTDLLGKALKGFVFDDEAGFSVVYASEKEDALGQLCALK